ncbi:hypothetical protein OIO90_002411 [Microbotryomycetes sp. JL221]|nr:hypothetical protein OIO90_002411 [Microbotryomycetes sp. JL221]
MTTVREAATDETNRLSESTRSDREHQKTKRRKPLRHATQSAPEYLPMPSHLARLIIATFLVPSPTTKERAARVGHHLRPYRRSPLVLSTYTPTFVDQVREVESRMPVPSARYVFKSSRGRRMTSTRVPRSSDGSTPGLGLRDVVKLEGGDATEKTQVAAKEETFMRSVEGVLWNKLQKFKDKSGLMPGRDMLLWAIVGSLRQARMRNHAALMRRHSNQSSSSDWATSLGSDHDALARSFTPAINRQELPALPRKTNIELPPLHLHPSETPHGRSGPIKRPAPRNFALQKPEKALLGAMSNVRKCQRGLARSIERYDESREVSWNERNSNSKSRKQWQMHAAFSQEHKRIQQFEAPSIPRQAVLSFMMTSDEVDWLVYSYLVESVVTTTSVVGPEVNKRDEKASGGNCPLLRYTHTSFSLLHESALAGPSTSSAPLNGRRPQANSVMNHQVPPGHLVRVLQKGLLYLEAEARFRGDPPEQKPRLVGYNIPNALPLPPLPKKTRDDETDSLSPPPPTDDEPPPQQQMSDHTKSSKGKGKEKERDMKDAASTSKRKGSDREDLSTGEGKRTRTQSHDRRKSTATTTSNGVDAMDIDKEVSAASSKVSKSVANGKRSASPVVRPTSPAAGRRAKQGAEPQSNTNAASSTSALASKSNLKSNGERRSSVPDAKKQQELARVKQEEGESSTHKENTFKGATVPIASVDMGSVDQVGIEDGQVITLKGHTVPKVQPCAWNPKVPTMLATGGGDSTARIWDCPTDWIKGKGQGKSVTEHIVCKHQSAQRRADVAAVAWDPSGSLLATGSEDGIARIWTPSGDLHLVLSMHQRSIFSLKWNSAGTMLLTGSLDSTVCLWELNNGRVKQQWSTHTDSVLDVDWNDDQTFASASMDKSVHLIGISRTSPIHRFKGHRDEVNMVKFSPCGTLLASASDDHTARVWSLGNIAGLDIEDKLTARDEGRLIDDQERGGVFILEGHTNDVHSIAWAPIVEGGPRLLASASFDHTARLWNADDGACLQVFAQHSDFVYSISFSPGLGTFLATGSNDGKMDVWRVKDNKLVLEYEHSGPIYELTWHPNGNQLAVCGRTEDVACVGFDASSATA